MHANVFGWVGGRADSLFTGPLAKTKEERSVLPQHGIYSPAIPLCTCLRALSLQERIIIHVFYFRISLRVL